MNTTATMIFMIGSRLKMAAIITCHILSTDPSILLYPATYSTLTLCLRNHRINTLSITPINHAIII